MKKKLLCGLLAAVMALRLAIGGRDADGFYPLCAVRVV